MITPDSALAFAQFRLLFVRILVETVRWVCYHGVDAIIGLAYRPIEAIGVYKLALPATIGSGV